MKRKKEQSALFFLLEGVRVAELVDEPLRTLRLLHDALAVVLADAAAQLVVVHGRPVLALAPQFGDADAVLDLEDAARTVQPADGRAVQRRLRQQLLQELPQVDVRPWPAAEKSAIILRAPHELASFTIVQCISWTFFGYRGYPSTGFYWVLLVFYLVLLGFYLV